MCLESRELCHVIASDQWQSQGSSLSDCKRVLYSSGQTPLSCRAAAVSGSVRGVALRGRHPTRALLQAPATGLCEDSLSPALLFVGVPAPCWCPWLSSCLFDRRR